jgi:hypothetical protein
LVRLDEDADPKAGLAQAALASDFERGEALWLIDAAKLDGLAAYGDAIKVLWSSARFARVPFTDAVYRQP